MTAKQNEVLDTCEELLREHFSGYILVVHGEDVDDAGSSETKLGWGGGIMLAIGLTEYARHKLKARAWSNDDEREQRERNNI